MDRVRRTINGFGLADRLWHTECMVDEPENLVLVYLRRIDSKIDALTYEVRELKERVSALELGQAALRKEIAFLAETDARMQISMDRMREDLSRIQRRLDLTEAPAA